jgi:ribokinase
MAKVAVVGSLVVDMAMRTPRLPRRGDNIHADEFRMGAGGKGGNAAAALARLGQRVLSIGCVGDDPLGKFELEALEAEGVDVSGVTVLANTPTAVAIVLVEEGGENAVLVANPTNERLTGAMVSKALRPHLPGVDAVLVNFECAPEAVKTTVMLGRECQIPVFVDPAPARRYDEDTWRDATVLAPNVSEAATLVGFELVDESGLERAAEKLRQVGPQVIVLKLGDQGAYLLHDAGAARISAIPVNVVDSTGAGDAFTAALVAAVLEDPDWTKAVRFANAAGALATTRFGTLDAMPHRHEIEALLVRVDQPER